MSNQVKSFNGVAIGNIKNINGLTDANIKNINGQTFTGSVPPDAFTINNAQFNGNRSWGTQMAWCQETDTLVVLYGDDGNGDYPSYRLGKLNATTGDVTITWQSETTISTAGAAYHNQPVFISGQSSGGNGRMGLAYLESGASSTNRYSIAFGTITNSGSTPSMSVGTPEVIHATSSGTYNQGDVSSIARYWEDMGAVVTALEYGDDDGTANFVKAFKMDTSDNSVISSGANELMFADTTTEFYNIEYDSAIDRLVVFSLQYVSSTAYIYGNILDYNASSTNGLELQLELSLPGTQLFTGTVASGYDAGAWCAYNASANIHHVLFNEAADSTKKVRNVKISGSDGSFTMDPHTTYELEIPSNMQNYSTIWYNHHRGMLGVMGSNTSRSSAFPNGSTIRALGYKFTEDTGTEANSTFSANGSEQTVKVSSHDLFLGRYLGMQQTMHGSDMHTGNFGAIMPFYDGNQSQEGVMIGFDTGG
tara:strand:- start:334 stop:1767 length:1434 start_codon:yes stop_codon:yes gene_type:complete